MTLIDEIVFFSSALVVIAMVNWPAGDRSFRGKRLTLRNDFKWSASRWVGPAIWIAATLAFPGKNPISAGPGLAGALLLLFGTARRAA